MNLLTDGLYLISTGLLVPCIVALLLCLGQGLFDGGRMVATLRGGGVSPAALADWFHAAAQSAGALPEGFHGLRCRAVAEALIAAESPARAQYLLANYEITADRKLARFGRLAKLGPVLGLIGTLIPMGPALQGLASGDLVQLSTQMQVAFTTTVVGLLVGVIGFLLYQQERRLVFAEISALEFIQRVKFEGAQHA